MRDGALLKGPGFQKAVNVVEQIIRVSHVGGGASGGLDITLVTHVLSHEMDAMGVHYLYSVAPRVSYRLGGFHQPIRSRQVQYRSTGLSVDTHLL